MVKFYSSRSTEREGKRGRESERKGEGEIEKVRERERESERVFCDLNTKLS